MTTATAPTPGLAIQLGAASRASRALLDRVLTRSDLTFEQWVVLRGHVTAEARGDAVPTTAELAAVLDQPVADLEAAVEGLRSRDLVAGTGAAPALTASGRALGRELVAEVDALGADVLAGLSEEDLAAASRVLLQWAERGKARLAAG
jgi:hypothetical protein